MGLLEIYSDLLKPFHSAWSDYSSEELLEEHKYNVALTYQDWVLVIEESEKQLERLETRDVDAIKSLSDSVMKS